MRYLVIAVVALSLSACSVTAQPPKRVTIDSDGTVTIDNSHKNNGAYRHCPPGQAKKGNC